MIRICDNSKDSLGVIFSGIELRLWGRNVVLSRFKLLYGVDQIGRILSLAKIGGQIEKSTMPKWETNLCIAVEFSPRKSTSEILDAVGLDYDSDKDLTKKVISEAHVYIPSEVLFHYGLLQSGLVEFLRQ